MKWILFILWQGKIYIFWQESKNNQNSWILETHSCHVSRSPLVSSPLSLQLGPLPWDAEVSSGTGSNWAGSREGPGSNDNGRSQDPDTMLTCIICYGKYATETSPEPMVLNCFIPTSCQKPNRNGWFFLIIYSLVLPNLVLHKNQLGFCGRKILKRLPMTPVLLMFSPWYNPLPWIWVGLVACFNQCNMENIMGCLFHDYITKW